MFEAFIYSRIEVALKGGIAFQDFCSVQTRAVSVKIKQVF